MDINSMVTRTSVEMNHGWALQNPELFTARVIQFHKDHPIEEWEHHIDMHSNWRMSFIAIRRTNDYNFDRDYLIEIGM